MFHGLNTYGLKSKQLKSFTIVELLVAMIISGIIFSFAWSGYFFLNRYADSLKGFTQSRTEIERLEYYLRKDVVHANLLTVPKPTEIVIELQEDTVRYLSSISGTQRLSGFDTTVLEVSSRFSWKNPKLDITLVYGVYQSQFAIRVDPESRATADSLALAEPL